ncbi:MAG: M48 family metallopeptidase [Candidatus Omnitrophota bacterium]
MDIPANKDIQPAGAKRYSYLKYGASVIDTIYLFLLLFVFTASGLSKILSQFLSGLISNNYFVASAYIFIVAFAYYLLSFPLIFFRSFALERMFSLSNQKFSSWLKDQLKAGIISYIIALILISAFYYIIRRFFPYWWLIISLFWIFFSLILAKLVPIVIIPLFFKYEKLTDEAVRERIIKLADKMKVRILDVFQIDFSKKTVKANAAFVGLGATKRVILSDTLKDKYSHDEIEVILAHEFAHYRLRHLIKLILLNSLAIMLSFYAIFITSGHILGLFGLSTLSDIAALPVILMYFVVLGIIMQPFENYISRRLERSADLEALKVTGLKEAFISMMEKLSSQNLADKNPHPLIKFFFFDHPPVDERIAIAKSL